MASWQEIGVDTFQSAILLMEGKKYRSAVSRFYYASFAALTHELRQRGAAGDFTQQRQTPGHGQLPGLIETWFTHFSVERRTNLARRVAKLYGNRIAADYSRERIDYVTAKEALRLSESIFEYLQVKK